MKLDPAFLERFTAEIGPVGKSLGMLIRPTFIAPPGKTLVWGDWSAIEARVLPWLAASPGAQAQLDIFLASDHDKTRPDVYVYNAAQLLGVDPQVMWDAFREGEKWAKDGRQSHGKVPVLSLGFGGAAGALMKMAINYKVYLDEATAQKMVDGWRAANQWAPDFWGKFYVDKHGEIERASGLWGAVNMALRNPGTAYEAGRVAYVFDPGYMDGTLFCALPCGRLLTYPDCKLRTRKVKDKDTGEESEKTAIWYRKGYGWSALWHGKCLAGDTLVATDQGWLPIAQVRSWHMLWDGEEWVRHDGLLHQGSKSTMPVNGVRMTPDHEVWTDAGWKPAAQLEGLHRPAVRLPNRLATRTPSWAWRERAVVGSVQLRHGEIGVEWGVAPFQSEAFAGVVRVQNRRDSLGSEPHARHDEAPGLRGVALDERPLPVADAPGVEELRRARHHGLRPVATLVRDVLGGHGAYLPARADARAQGQRAGLQPGELLLGDVEGASEQPAQPMEEQVYDLLNAGPRRRFVVLGESGPFIVHNCAENITQAVAGSILRETLVRLEELTGEVYPVVAHTHDEVITEVDDNPEDIANARAALEETMGEWRPEWRADLPLTAEVTESLYYTKSLG